MTEHVLTWGTGAELTSAPKCPVRSARDQFILIYSVAGRENARAQKMDGRKTGPDQSRSAAAVTPLIGLLKPSCRPIYYIYIEREGTSVVINITEALASSILMFGVALLGWRDTQHCTSGEFDGMQRTLPLYSYRLRACLRLFAYSYRAAAKDLLLQVLGYVL